VQEGASTETLERTFSLSMSSFWIFERVSTASRAFCSATYLRQHPIRMSVQIQQGSVKGFNRVPFSRVSFACFKSSGAHMASLSLAKLSLICTSCRPRPSAASRLSSGMVYLSKVHTHLSTVNTHLSTVNTHLSTVNKRLCTPWRSSSWRCTAGSSSPPGPPW
jgi:hypothetical protein